MNRIEVTTNGSVMEGLNLLRVADDYANDSVYVNHAEVEQAQAAGPQDVDAGHQAILELVVENIGETGFDILQSAVTNGSPVSIDGADVTPAVAARALKIDPPAGPTA